MGEHPIDAVEGFIHVLDKEDCSSQVDLVGGSNGRHQEGETPSLESPPPPPLSQRSTERVLSGKSGVQSRPQARLRSIGLPLPKLICAQVRAMEGGNRTTLHEIDKQDRYVA